MPNLKIRRAEKSDFEAWRELKEIIQNEHHFHNPDYFVPYKEKELEFIFKETLSDKSLSLCIALLENTIVGYMLLTCLDTRDELGSPGFSTLRVLEICVHPQSRHQGIGRTMMDEAIMISKQLECRDITLTVWQTNSMAKEFYLNYGFQTITERMRLKITN